MRHQQPGLFSSDTAAIPLLRLLAWTAGSIGFGFALGTYAGFSDAFLAAWKVPLVLLLSVLVTVPTLAVLTPLTGGTLSLRRSAYMALLALAYIGSLLLALAPVMWLFAASSWYLAWSVVVAVGLGLVALVVTAYRIGVTNRSERKAIVLWALLLIPVTLQIATVLRPVVTPQAPRGPERVFFLEHFGNVADFRLPESEVGD